MTHVPPHPLPAPRDGGRGAARPLPIPVAARAFALALALGAALVASPARAQFEDQAIAAFLEADANGDEVLTPEEFRVFISRMADFGAPMSRRIRNFGAYGLAFRNVDSNRDGLATPEELRAAEAGN